MKSSRLAEMRYASGYSAYMEVLDANRDLFAAELALSGVQRDALVAVVQVYKALGGEGRYPDARRRPRCASRRGSKWPLISAHAAAEDNPPVLARAINRECDGKQRDGVRMRPRRCAAP